MNVPPQTSSGLGLLDHEPKGILKVSKKLGTYTTYTENDRFKIGKYASENVNLKSLARFKQKIPKLKGIPVRFFKKNQYHDELTCSIMEKLSSNKVIIAKQSGRHLLPQGLDGMKTSYRQHDLTGEWLIQLFG